MMALLPTGFKTLVLIETDTFDFYINGNISNKKADALKLNLNTSAYFNISYEGEGDYKAKTVTSNGEVAENYGYEMLPCFYEDGNYQIYIKKKQEIELELYHISDEIKNSIIRIGDVLIGDFSFKEEIGHSTFKIKCKDKIILTQTIEVFPSKMDYAKDYKEIMTDINEEISALAFEFLGRTFHTATLVNTDHQTQNEFFNILKIIYERFDTAIKRVEKFPKHNVVGRHEINDAHRSKKTARSAINFIKKHPETLYKSEKGIVIGSEHYMPSVIIEEKKETTKDIYENRYVKYILKTILNRIIKVKENFAINNNTDHEYYQILQGIERKISTHINIYFRDIGDIQGSKSLSLVFHMAPGYREVYYYFMMLKKGLSLSEDIYSITPKKIWKLYEMWCYIKLHSILKEFGYDVVDFGILKVRDNGLHLSLLQDETSVMRYKNTYGKEIELWYNKSYAYLPTTDQRPDTVLCMREKGFENRMYIFDAKYRIYVDNTGVAGPVEDDLNVMHRYRDAIVAELNEVMEFKYQTFGAYVMFPYGDEKTYENHKYFKSIEKVNIGAFPMLPGSISLIEGHIKKILNESRIEANERVLHHVTEDDYSRFKLENVMVAIVPDERHLEAYIEHKFYHIPVKTLANVRVGVEYIAFYQSDTGFKDAAGIKYYGKIKEIRRYKRGECTEIPNSTRTLDEEYLRFELEDICAVGPIGKVEYGIRTVMYTTLYLLKNAENVHELKLKSRDEIVFYKMLKEIAEKRMIGLKRFKDYYMLGDRKVELLDGKKVRVDGVIFGLMKAMDVINK